MKQTIKDVFYFLTKRVNSPTAPLHIALEESHPIYIQIHSENSILQHSNRSLPTWSNEQGEHLD